MKAGKDHRPPKYPANSVISSYFRSAGILSRAAVGKIDRVSGRGLQYDGGKTVIDVYRTGGVKPDHRGIDIEVGPRIPGYIPGIGAQDHFIAINLSIPLNGPRAVRGDIDLVGKIEALPCGDGRKLEAGIAS